MAAKAMLDIVVAGNENRHARSRGKSGDRGWVVDATRDIVALVQCSEARHWVPAQYDFEVGNFAVVDGKR